MPHPAIEHQRDADLRARAAHRLRGAAAAKGATAGAADALAVLHALASSPATAPDALALLHELQVHQVELELQAEELRESRAELESALRRQVELYDAQPYGSFTVDAGLVVHQLNQTGARMLGIGHDEAHGSNLDTFVGASARRQLVALIANVAAGTGETSGLVSVTAADGQERQVRVHVGAAATANLFIVAMSAA